MKPTGLTNQVRRAAVSIPAHIAGGPGRIDTAGFAQVRSMAHGSLGEVEPHLLSASRSTHTGNVTVAASFDRAAGADRLIQDLPRDEVGSKRKAGRPATRGRDRLSLRRTA